MIRVAALFAGIGGIELGLSRAMGPRLETPLISELWAPAQGVLAARFPESELHPDIRTLTSLPAGVDLVTAGFPCTDLSQAGRTAGIDGAASGLVSHVFAALRVARADRELPMLMVENVPNMLALDRGRAMAYLVAELESLGYRWAYRVIDSRFTGVPQRRRRVILIASATVDPRTILFADDSGPRPEADYRFDGFGFYWTEGRGGLGWAVDAVPTLKGGSTIGIPSPPAIWVPAAPEGRRLVKPSIEDAEEMQGFPRGWTATGEETNRRNGPRWKLVGNAVTVGVSEWVGRRIATPGDVVSDEELWEGRGAWPTAAWGEAAKVWRVRLSEFPEHQSYRHLLDVVDAAAAEPLSERAATGFLRRLQAGNLGRHPGFREDVAGHVTATRRQPTIL
jgi:DNA (cytosine-5)-methyltransferase 1